jgi:holo-[acyl-carrier protein] synthase
MILGIGIDLVDVLRIEAIIFRWQERFLRRIFTDKEISYCNNKKDPAQRFATRYAAKEAVVKALYPKGTEGISMHDIEIGQSEGRPEVALYNQSKDYSEKLGVKKIFIMLSHDGNYGVAQVILEG